MIFTELDKVRCHETPLNHIEKVKNAYIWLNSSMDTPNYSINYSDVY